jgi:prophage DNA circulation protein
MAGPGLSVGDMATGGGGPSDRIAKISGVTEDARCERTANLLIARLEALARTADRLPHPAVERLVELASVATMRAVALQLLDAERAESIWQDAHSRHPALREVEVQLPPALAA